MTAPTSGLAYAALQGKKNQLIRKTKNGSFFIAPGDAPLITTLTGADSLLKALPTGYVDLGWLSDDGVNMPREVETSEVSGYGSTTPLRTDIVSDVTSVEVVPIETNRATIEQYTGVDLADITIGANGELSFPKPTTFTSRKFRGLVLGVDATEAGEIYMARFFPRLSISGYDDQSHTSGDDPLGWAVTYSSEEDAAAGYAERWIFGGPGWLALLDDMGFEAAPATP